MVFGSVGKVSRVVCAGVHFWCVCVCVFVQILFLNVFVFRMKMFNENAPDSTSLVCLYFVAKYKHDCALRVGKFDHKMSRREFNSSGAAFEIVSLGLFLFANWHGATGYGRNMILYDINYVCVCVYVLAARKVFLPLLDSLPFRVCDGKYEIRNPRCGVWIDY